MEYHQTKTKTQIKRTSGGTELPETKTENAYWEFPYINNYSNRTWTEFTNKKAQCRRLDQKTKPNICCLQEIYLNCKEKYRFKVKDWKMILQANGIQRKACVAIFISDKNKFYHRITDKDEHFLMIKGILQQEDITLLNTYAPNQGALK